MEQVRIDWVLTLLLHNSVNKPKSRKTWIKCGYSRSLSKCWKRPGRLEIPRLAIKIALIKKKKKLFFSVSGWRLSFTRLAESRRTLRCSCFRAFPAQYWLNLLLRWGAATHLLSALKRGWLWFNPCSSNRKILLSLPPCHQPSLG